MSSPQEFSDELIKEFTVSPPVQDEKLIRHLPIPKPSTISRTSNSSSLGQLDLLPAEILLEVLKLADFQSLSRLSRTSLRGKDVVEALRLYREVMRYYPKLLAALGKTHLLRHHSSSLVRQVLSEQKCASCLDFGGFLFLPTCERVCFECLSKNFAFHLAKVSFAKKWFALTSEQLRRIPIMQSIPGRYRVTFTAKHSQPHKLVSVKQLLQLAIDVHGSPENVARLMPAWSPAIHPHDFKTLAEFHKAPLQPPGCDLSKLPFNSILYDKYPGMASIRMPSLTSSGFEYGRQCRGCRHVQRKHLAGRLPSPVMEELVPSGLDPERVLDAMVIRLRARREFVEHLGQCHGVRWLLDGEGEVSESDFLDAGQI